MLANVAMDVNTKIKYWLDLAHYDLVSAKAMLESKRFLYVGLLCHQTVEKCLKRISGIIRRKNRHIFTTSLFFRKNPVSMPITPIKVA